MGQMIEDGSPAGAGPVDQAAEAPAASHTSGPWHVEPVKNWSIETHACAIIDDGRFPVAFCPAWDEETDGPAAPDEAAANAHLIANAPATAEAAKGMLAMLKACVAMIDDSLDGNQFEDGVYGAGITDVELTPDGSVKLSDVRAAIAAAHAAGIKAHP